MKSWDTVKLDPAAPRYLAICDAIESGIRQGSFGPGRRLPSHRALARQLGVSVGTVTRAYEEAIARGLISGEAGRGTFVSHDPPDPLRVIDSTRVPSTLIDLYQNLPVAVPQLENRAWGKALQALSRDNDLASLGRRSWSELAARHQIAGASWIRRTGLEVRPHNVFDCPGSMAALCAIFGALTDAGDVIFAAELSHPLIKTLAAQFSLTLRGLPIDEYGVIPEALERACQGESPRLIYCSPTIHSPTTATIPAERRFEIARLAEKYDAVIVEDEAAAFLLADPPLPLSAHAPHRSFFIGDLWMSLSMGLRQTFVLVPDAYLDAMATAVAASSGVTTPMMAEIATYWLESGLAQELIEARRTELGVRNAIACEVLGQRGLRSHPCGHHVWFELPDAWRSDLFTLRAKEVGVAVGSASWFAVGHTPTPEAVRLCVGNVATIDQLREALERLDKLLNDPDGAKD